MKREKAEPVRLRLRVRNFLVSSSILTLGVKRGIAWKGKVAISEAQRHGGGPRQIPRERRTPAKLWQVPKVW
jgi:hypothetical protein